MLGTIILLLLVPFVLWAASEIVARSPALRLALNSLFATRTPPPKRPGAPTCGPIGRPPDLPPRLSLHDRSPLPCYDPGPGEPNPDDDLRA